MPDPENEYFRWIGRSGWLRNRRWTVIEFLEAESQLVLQADGKSTLQDNRHGDAHRRVPETLTVNVSGEIEPEVRDLLRQLQSDSI